MLRVMSCACSFRFLSGNYRKELLIHVQISNQKRQCMRFVVRIQPPCFSILYQLRKSSYIRRDQGTSNQLCFTYCVRRIVNDGRMNTEIRFFQLFNNLPIPDNPDQFNIDILASDFRAFFKPWH